MKINRVEIKEYGRFHNRMIEFAEGLNVLPGIRKEEQMAIHAFIRQMLYGRPKSQTGQTEKEAVGEGIIWFEAGGKKFRLTRSFTETEDTGELFCETSGEILNAQQDKIDSVLGDISESIFDNAVYVTALKNPSGSSLVREVQNYIKSSVGTGDGNLELGRTMQMLKMSRKGYQVQMERDRKVQTEQQKLLVGEMKKLRREAEDLEEEKEQIRSQETSLRMTEADNGENILDEKIAGLERKNFIQTTVLIMTVLLTFAGALIFAMQMQRPIWAVTVAAAGILVSLAEGGFQMGTVRELEKRKRYRKRWLNRQGKLKESREILDEEQKEKITAITNLMEEHQEAQEHAHIPLAEELEIDSLNLAIDTINRLSGRIWNRLGEDMLAKASEILNDVTAGKCREIIFDTGSHVSIHAGEEEIPIEKLNRGMLGLLYFAFCMAAGTVMAGEEELPVMMEDIFGMFGQEQFLVVMGWLAVSGRQTAVCISHTEEVELLQKAGISCTIL